MIGAFMATQATGGGTTGFWLALIAPLFSDQNERSALKIIDRAYVIDEGAIRFEEMRAELEAVEKVKKKYL